MKKAPYLVVLLLASVCVVLSVTLVLVTQVNQDLQLQAQTQQQKLNQGILGQQAQEISAGVLQDLADAAVGNVQIRRLLEKHGYRMPSPSSPAPGTNAPGVDPGESSNTGMVKP